jgi:hypothetical protein
MLEFRIDNSVWFGFIHIGRISKHHDNWEYISFAAGVPNMLAPSKQKLIKLIKKDPVIKSNSLLNK